jgi:MFS family permease
MFIKRIFLGATPQLCFGFLLTFSSSIGQTFFISLFAGEIRSELNLSHGMFGTFYSAATLTSALVFLWFGKFTDQFNLILLGLIACVALSSFSLMLANTNTLFLLFLSLLGLRFFGQGLLGHVAVTAMACWFSKKRGQALSFAALVAFFFTLLTWREIWFAVCLCIILIFLPVLYWLGKCIKSRSVDNSKNNLIEKKDTSYVSWTRAQVIKDFRFYQIIPGLLASPFIITGVLFHQVHLIETKSWSLKMFASCYPLYALSAAGIMLAAGWIVDRLSAVYLLRFYLLPLGLGLILLATTDKTYIAPIFMLLAGGTAGAATIVMGALWVELYGTNYLGSIRSMCFAIMVISTSIAPGLMGLLLDIGVTLETQLFILAIYIFICTVIFIIIMPSLLAKHPPSAS